MQVKTTRQHSLQINAGFKKPVKKCITKSIRNNQVAQTGNLGKYNKKAGQMPYLSLREFDQKQSQERLVSEVMFTFQNYYFKINVNRGETVINLSFSLSTFVIKISLQEMHKSLYCTVIQIRITKLDLSSNTVLFYLGYNKFSELMLKKLLFFLPTR